MTMNLKKKGMLRIFNLSYWLLSTKLTNWERGGVMDEIFCPCLCHNVFFFIRFVCFICSIEGARQICSGYQKWTDTFLLTTKVFFIFTSRVTWLKLLLFGQNNDDDDDMITLPYKILNNNDIFITCSSSPCSLSPPALFPREIDDVACPSGATVASARRA